MPYSDFVHLLRDHLTRRSRNGSITAPKSPKAKRKAKRAAKA